MDILLILLILFMYVFLFFTFGTYMTRNLKDNNCTIGLTVFIGFFMYYFIFQIISLPLILTRQALSTLSIVWTVVVLLVFIFSMVLNKNVWKHSYQQIISHKWWNPASVIIFLIILAQIVLVLSHYTNNHMDAAYYVGKVSTDVYTNTIGQYDPYTGEKLAFFAMRYLPATYNVHDAVICQLSGLHPLIETKTTMSVIVILLSNLVSYKCAEILFQDYKKAQVCMFFFISIINLFNYSAFTSSGFYFYRTFEGKSILANIILPAIFYTFLRLYKDRRSNANWFMMLIISCSGNAISMSSLMIVPVAITAAIGTLFLLKPDRTLIPRYLICIIPCLAGLVYYLAMSKGFMIPV